VSRDCDKQMKGKKKKKKAWGERRRGGKGQVEERGGRGWREGWEWGRERRG